MTSFHSTHFKYQFDRSASHADNKIIDELHTFAISDPRVFVLRNGVFYTEGLVLTRAVDGSIMDLGTDYVLASMEDEVTARTGHMAACAIRLTDANFIGDILVSHQVVGGPEGYYSVILPTLTEEIKKIRDVPAITWSQIVGKPRTFPSKDHRHPPQDLDDLDLLGVKFREALNAIANTRPTGTSNLGLLGKIERLLGIVLEMSAQMNTLQPNDYLLDRIQELEDLILNYPAKADFNEEVIAGDVVVVTWDKSMIDSAEGYLHFEGPSNSSSLVFSLIRHGQDMRHTTVRKMFTDDDVDTHVKYHLTETLTTFELVVTVPEDGRLKAKWLHLL